MSHLLFFPISSLLFWIIIHAVWFGRFFLRVWCHFLFLVSFSHQVLVSSFTFSSVSFFSYFSWTLRFENQIAATVWTGSLSVNFGVNLLCLETFFQTLSTFSSIPAHVLCREVSHYHDKAVLLIGGPLWFNAGIFTGFLFSVSFVSKPLFRSSLLFTSNLQRLYLHIKLFM